MFQPQQPQKRVPTARSSLYKKRIFEILEYVKSRIAIEDDVVSDLIRGIDTDFNKYRLEIPDLYEWIRKKLNENPKRDIADSIVVLMEILEKISIVTQMSRLEWGIQKGGFLRYIELHEEIAIQLPSMIRDVMVMVNRPL